ncbi:hypothetical protein [Ralstonia syzygii]|uniref:hypothetical protein n=1 Tax=Ralstonia syzygii TaxID=28097 RepID=UPI0018D0D900|nr:hypothetical protein [Ralstonia syzygii]
MSHLEISSDGKRIAWVSGAGSPEWAATAPTPAEWKQLTSFDRTQEFLEGGVYAWVNGIVDDEVAVVFSPRGGLDFNLFYSISSGCLLRITEAR